MRRMGGVLFRFVLRSKDVGAAGVISDRVCWFYCKFIQIFLTIFITVTTIIHVNDNTFTKSLLK